jgi:serine protease Do
MRLTVLFVAAALLPGQAPRTAPPASLHGISQVVEQLVERVDPAVAQILTSGLTPADEPSGIFLKTAKSSGSGVIVDASGYIVTNAHVVAGGRRVQVVIPLRHDESVKVASILKPSGKTVPAEVIGTDSETDVAVLKVEEQGLTPLGFADSEKLRQGQVVFAFGSPYGLENSVSMGIVSAVARQLKPDHPMIYIQTDAAINPGNSGGPLVDVEGRIAGLNTFILSGSGGSEGIGFAVPANIVRRVYEQIRKDGYVRRGQAGVIAQTITPAMAQALSLPLDYGVYVADVTPGGAAAAAGIEVKDIILKLNGKPMENARQFGVNIYQMAGETATVEVLRAGQTKTLRMAVLERPRDPGRLLRGITQSENLVPRLGLLAVTLDEKITPILGPARRLSGVVVAALLAGTQAQGSLMPGDIVYEVNGRKVASLAELRETVAALPAGRPAAFWIERAGQLQIVMVDLE